MKLIDRYIYAVTERLPEKIRDDVSRELHTNIEDMLPENYTETEIREVLKKLGNPKKLAEEYNPTKRYLIGPGLYDKYLTVLKLVIGIVTTVIICITIFEWVLNPTIDGSFTQISIDLMIDLIAAVIQSIMQVILWVTLVFAIIEINESRSDKRYLSNKDWSLDDLPVAPMQKSRISRGETIVTMIGIILFTVIIYFKAHLIGIYEVTDKNGEGFTLITPLFHSDRLESYIGFIIIIAIIQLGFSIWKFIRSNWTMPLAVTNVIINVILCILLIVMIRDTSLFNPEFINKIAELTSASQAKIQSIWDRNLLIIAGVFIAISIKDSISILIKSKK